MALAEWNPREADIVRFTQGDCHIFAWTIHRITGWPIASFDAEHDPTGDIHAFCVLPDGRIIDVEGVHEPKEFVKTWNRMWSTAQAYSLREWEPMKVSWGGPQYGRYSYARARVLARRLLEHFGFDAAGQAKMLRELREA